MQKPRYSLTRQAFWASFVFAWGVIFAILCVGLYGEPQAVELAGLFVPSMVFLIASVLGIHRAFGSMDYRSSANAAADAPPYDPRADPAGEQQ